MKHQKRAALISLAIHGVFIAAVTSITAISVPAMRTLTIDFSVEKPPMQAAAATVAPPPAPRHIPKPASLPKKEEDAFPDTAAAEDDADTAEFADAEANAAGDEPKRVAFIGPAAIPQDTGAIRDKERRKYLKEQFEYIRDIIYRKAVYPAMALEMKITGTVLLSFCVREDGGVESIEIVTGSGASILDQDALSTVKRAAPFPRPPVRVMVKFPLEYRLE